jgi:multidrug transporter EmrE-like cation transporter
MAKRINIPTLCILLSLLFQTATAGLGKQAALTVGEFSVLAVLRNPYYVASIACLAGHAITWQLVLRQYPLSLAYPFMSGVYVSILILSRFVFHEDVSLCNVVGAALIISGIVLLTRGTPGEVRG